MLHLSAIKGRCICILGHGQVYIQQALNMSNRGLIKKCHSEIRYISTFRIFKANLLFNFCKEVYIV